MLDIPDHAIDQTWASYGLQTGPRDALVIGGKHKAFIRDPAIRNNTTKVALLDTSRPPELSSCRPPAVVQEPTNRNNPFLLHVAVPSGLQIDLEVLETENPKGSIQFIISSGGANSFWRDII